MMHIMRVAGAVLACMIHVSNASADPLLSPGITGTPYVSGVAAPFAIDVQKQEAEERSLRAWGYIGDGTSHVLSAVRHVGGRDTADWTLGQWQTVLPCVTAMTDEIDWAALQCYIDSVGAGTATLQLSGVAVINKTIVSRNCSASIQIKGQGVKTLIKQTGTGQGGIWHCPVGQGTGSFDLLDIGVVCAAIGGCGDAVVVSARSVVSDTTDITSEGPRWANGWKLIGGGGHTFQRSNVYMGAGKIVGTCFHAETPVSTGFTVLILVDNSHFFSCGIGVKIKNNGVTSGIEGVRFHNVDIDMAIKVVVLENNKEGYQPPEYVFDTLQASFIQSLLSVEGKNPIVKSVWLTKSWLIQIPPNAASGAVAPVDIINLGQSDDVWITDNTFSQSAGAAFDWFINIPAGAVNWHIRGNAIEILLGKINKGLVNLQRGAKRILERDNMWSYAGTTVANGAPAEISIVSDHWLFLESGGKCAYAAQLGRGTISGRRIVCQDSVVGTTDAKGQLAIEYPVRFAAAPTNIVASSGDNGLCDGAVNPVAASYGATGVTLRATACPRTSVRFNYTVTGP